MHVDAAARQIGRSRRTLYYWMAAGKLPFTTSNGSRHVRIEDVRTLNTRRRRQMADDPKDIQHPAAEQVSDDATGSTTEPTPAEESDKPDTTIE